MNYDANVKVSELESYIKLAKKHKLKSMHIGDIHFELREPTKRKAGRAATPNHIPILGEQMPSDDEMLFYSVPGINPLPNS